MDLLTSNYIDKIRDIVQILFYLITIFLGILTYKNARKSILSPVNTEYQKRVFDRLTQLLDVLSHEFRMSSDKYWLTQTPMKNTLKELCEEYEKSKEQVDQLGVFEYLDLPASSQWIELSKLADEVEYDPFIPKHIRQMLLNHLVERAEACDKAHTEAIRRFVSDINKRKKFQELNIENYELENRYIDELKKQGYDIESVENEIKKIKNEIQAYMESFNPIK